MRLIKAESIIWTLVFALTDVLLVLNSIHIFVVEVAIIRFLAEILIGVSIYVVMIITYGKLFINFRNLVIILFESIILGTANTFYFVTPYGIGVHTDIIKMLLAILGVSTITVTLRVLNLGLEGVARREIIPILLYALMILSPLAVGIVYKIVYCTFFVFTEIMFINLLGLKE